MTGQRYVSGGGATTPIEPSATLLTPAAHNVAQLTPTVDSRQTPVSISVFLANNVFTDDLSPNQAGLNLHQRLQIQPVVYTSILDAIPLLRTFLPKGGLDADYALLIRQKAIIGFAWLGSDSYEAAEELNARQLMGDVLQVDADGVILSTTWGMEESAFNQSRIRSIDKVADALSLFKVVLHDWLTIHPRHTESYLIAGYGEETLAKVATIDEVTFCYDHCTFPVLANEEEGEDDE